MKIENAQTIFFKSKDEYKAFRASWAKAVNSKVVKLTAAHHALYLILRGRDSMSGFTPIKNPTKLANGRYPDQAHDAAIGYLKWLTKRYTVEKPGLLQRLVGVEESKRQYLSRVKEFISPLGEELYSEQFLRILEERLE